MQVSIPTAGGAFGVTTLPDGDLIMVVQSEAATDLDVYLSSDGLVWKQVADQILARFSKYGVSSFAGIVAFRMDASGDYTTILLVERR